MTLANDPRSTSNLIRLDEAFLASHDREQTEKQLRRIVRSVRFELLDSQRAFRILGPDMSYHNIDPYLPQALRQFRKDMVLSEIISYRSRRSSFDLCFEDSWTGYFIAERLSESSKQEDLVLLHLDDHTDMMPTLLLRSAQGLTDPTTGRSFDPVAADDWEAAIHSGCISIGSFVTALFFSGHKVHVRHLNNFRTSTYRLYNVTRESYRHGLIPDKGFAAIRKRTADWQRSAGTYLGGASADEVLSHVPEGRLIVHIDLDYFVNDFNGNAVTDYLIPDVDLLDEARRKMEAFFKALRRVASNVDRWIVATSPGFCSAYHWHWLLAEIEEKIKELGASRDRGTNGLQGDRWR